jgi:methyl-accepting chemotaxis protein
VKIGVRLTIALLVAAILPLFLSGLWSLFTLHRANDLAVEQGEAAMTRVGEDMILLAAEAVARQVALYLATHPEVDQSNAIQLEANAALAEIAVQPVGQTGYTALFDENAVTHFHSNPDLIGVDLGTLADQLPDFWVIIAASLDGSASSGYYDWEDPDGQVRPKYMSVVPVEGTTLRVAATTYIDEFSQPVVQVKTALDRVRNAARIQLLVALVIVALMTVAGAYFLGQHFSRPISQMVATADQIADGDLRAEPPYTDMGELGHLATTFRRMTDHLSSLIHRVHDISLGLTSAAEQVMLTHRQHLSHSNEQAAAVANSSVAVEELASSSAHIADNAQQVVSMANETRANTQQGVEAMTESFQHLQHMADASEVAINKVRILSSLAQEIGVVMNLIEDIAAQTKMIAFNASIEASASGEAGRRFSVVAGEVRHLAGDVAQSTEEIRDKVERIQTTTNELIIASEQEGKVIESGKASSEFTIDLLDRIHQSAEQTALAIQQISLSTQQQQRATEQLLADLHPLTQGARAIAAGSEGTVAVMEDLVAMAQGLNQAIERFRLPDAAQHQATTE